ncbi:hypothetical protein CPB86DRAFT_796762 [Serendipita vermifera]|nr:hypothetical protein CPB86DRAFT_796762 [Serendipita vermifera]
MKQQVVRNIILEREREIQSLEAKLKDLEQARDNDISQKQASASQKMKELQTQMDKIAEDVDAYIEARKTEMHREQGPIDERIETLKRENEASRASIAPIGRDPNEILVLIFRQYVDLNLPVWDLAEISSYWRDVALNTPHLWNVLEITGSLREFFLAELRHDQAFRPLSRQEAPMHQAQ